MSFFFGQIVHKENEMSFHGVRKKGKEARNESTLLCNACRAFKLVLERKNPRTNRIYFFLKGTHAIRYKTRGEEKEKRKKVKKGNNFFLE